MDMDKTETRPEGITVANSMRIESSLYHVAELQALKHSLPPKNWFLSQYNNLHRKVVEGYLCVYKCLVSARKLHITITDFMHVHV